MRLDPDSQAVLALIVMLLLAALLWSVAQDQGWVIGP